jgi:UDP-N-acetylmuramoylalanine--D-glutamate ligase
MEINNRKIVVIGLGQTGFDTAVFLSKRGADVFITETAVSESINRNSSLLKDRNIKTEVGGHTEKFLKGADMLVVSPGIPDTSLPVQYALTKKIPLISEIELAFSFSESKKIIAITGTNGKTTTTSLTGSLFENAGLPYITCGNIGNTFIGEIDRIHNNTWVILEVSSFQMEKTLTFKPFLGCLLNIAEDHFDRHPSMDEYIRAKKRLFINQGEKDLAVLNYDDAYCRNIAGTLKSKKFFFSHNELTERGTYIKSGRIFSTLKGMKEEVAEIYGTKLWGKGNEENIMASVTIGMLCGITEKNVIRKTLSDFTPLHHRLEKVGTVKKVTFINDSKSTNTHSVINALESFKRNNNIILIMGGKDKGISFSGIIPYLKNRVKMMIFLGETKKRLEEEFKNTGTPYKTAQTLKDAVRISAENSKGGDIVLFSPGCSSFDMFTNYKERGDVFKKEVQSLF